MRTLLRYFLINTVALYLTTEAIKGLSYSGGVQTLLLGGLVFTGINLILIPLLRILLLPLNLLTVGVFAWVTNVLALYALTALVPAIRLSSFDFPGLIYQGFTVPPAHLSALWVAILSSLLIGLLTHVLHWLMH